MRVKARRYCNRLTVGGGGNNLPAGTDWKQEREMKTPTAIFLGLTLIAAAIFFREPSIKSAHAALGGVDGFSCAKGHLAGGWVSCAILDGDEVHFVGLGSHAITNWKTNEYKVLKVK